MKAFLVCVFIAAILLCTLAAITGLMPLYYLGAVIAIASVATALTGTWLNDLLKEDTK